MSIVLLIPANIFQPLIDVFEAVLKFFHNSLGVPWGWAIVLLTVVVRAILLPLAFKQFHSMQKLQRVAPQLKQIQNKYKDDKQRQQQEIIKFYKENEVKPFASFLPLVAQIPVFIGLYYMLRQSLRVDICPQVQAAYKAAYAAAHHVSLASASGQTTYCTNPHYSQYYHGGAGFLFIPDLTNQATGLVLVALIVLYVGSQLASSLMMATPTMDKNQRRIMLLLPLLFVIIVINFPAGLLVYWITTNLWTIGQQYVIRRRLGPASPPVTADGRAPATSTNRAGSSGGVGGLLERPRPAEQEPTASGTTPKRQRPPPSPRKRKKRSGRRR